MISYTESAKKIVEEQQKIIGPLAFQMALTIGGFQSRDGKNLVVEGDEKRALHNLIFLYSQLFGPASIEVCKDAIGRVNPQMTPDELREVLQ